MRSSLTLVQDLDVRVGPAVDQLRPVARRFVLVERQRAGSPGAVELCEDLAR